ncbi:DUF6199 family natural product biosynthesis protein [Paenibacillus turicensis]|uniref:DUF6199 family natural product biosynthesis protein n=1 Tax=Paenibacillus turicensis TaxID=160487 RepID=UPI003D2AD8D3
MFFPIITIIFGLIFIGLGILRIKNPEFGLQRNVRWKFKDEVEPSESYLLFLKFGGIVVIIAGVFVTLFGIMSLLQAIYTSH